MGGRVGGSPCSRGSHGSFWRVRVCGNVPTCPTGLSLLSALSPCCSSRAEVKLGRSESLKGREEMKKSRKAENVPRSRSDVDMDAAAEATRLHQSASSSASSLSTRWETPSESRAGRTWVPLGMFGFQRGAGTAGDLKAEPIGLRRCLLGRLLLSLWVKAQAPGTQSRVVPVPQRPAACRASWPTFARGKQRELGFNPHLCPKPLSQPVAPDPRLEGLMETLPHRVQRWEEGGRDIET